MLQLMDLAKENAALKCELARIRQEAEELRLFFGGDGAAQTTSGASATPQFRQSILAATEDLWDSERLAPGRT
jgi:hypothetical protein